MDVLLCYSEIRAADTVGCCEREITGGGFVIRVARYGEYGEDIVGEFIYIDTWSRKQTIKK